MTVAEHLTEARFTAADLAARIATIDRISLAHLPTPLDHCPRFTAELGGPQIWLKRDDLTGLAFGGNKTRQLEFLFADIMAKGADTIVAGAYTQSNWCRQMTAAACKLGLKASLVLLHGQKGGVLQGNLLLDHLMGATVEVVDEDDIQKLPLRLADKAEILAAAGAKPYVVAPFDLPMLSLSAVGYVNAAVELDAQCAAAGIDPTHVYTSGANMTPAGLALGLKALRPATRLVNVAPIKWDEARDVDIARIANGCADRLGLDLTLAPEDIDNHDGYIGPGYGIVTPESRAALRLLAQTEGVFLDPVYSSKAMAGLIDHVKTGRLSKDDTVIFLHTGGTPALFAYTHDVLED